LLKRSLIAPPHPFSTALADQLRRKESTNKVEQSSKTYLANGPKWSVFEDAAKDQGKQVYRYC